LYQLIKLQVNGDEYNVAIKPQETLLDVLRDKLELTGTKKGCEVGICGSCTVLVDNTPMNACLLLAVNMGGKAITTIEGLEDKGELHPIQQSFINSGAIQCGYCTPGMIMSARALIDRNPKPDEAEIKEALGGNLCRCTGYKRIIEAVKKWEERGYEKEFKSKDGDLEKYKTIGKSLPRYDARDKATGKAQYTGDLTLPRMLYGKILHSPIAHGIIKKIDTSKAEALPGVKAVITGQDVPDRQYGVSPPRYDEFVLAKDKVRYVGDEVAAVAAIDEETAEKALDLIEVEYEEFPAVLDVYEAMKDDTPLIHERYPNNINTKVDHHFGDVEQGFKEADYIREENFTGNFTQQAPMEPHAAIADWQDDLLVLYSSTQVPHYLHYMLANVFDMPLGKIKIIRPTVGGGFGAKAGTTPLDLCTAILSKETGCPVKMVYSREEMFLYHRGRHKQYMRMKLGVKKDGRITALESRIYLDGGAYTSFGIITVYYAGSMIPTLYKIPNYKYTGRRVMTNKPACGAFRGHGSPQPRFAFECLLNMICDDFHLDPVEVRRINGMEPNFLTCNDLQIRSCEYKATLEEAAKASGFREKYGSLPMGKGVGIASGGFVSGSGYAIYRGQVQQHSQKPREPFQKKSIFPHANAIIKISEDGTQAVLFIEAAEIGQGSDTILPMVAAEALGLPPDRVRIRSEDSDISPIDLGAYSSRTTLMGGNAVRMAAEDVLRKLLPVAAEMLSCPVNDLRAEDGIIYSINESGQTLEWAEAARKYFNDHSSLVGTGWYKPPEGLGGDYKGSTVGTSPAFSYSTAICELNVDLETGMVKMEKFWDYHDCGTPLNPLSVHGQVEGAIVMSSSEALMEDMVYDEKGVLVNPDLHKYLLMTIKDTPEIFSGIVDSYEPEGPYGAKEVGEGATVPILGAVAHAIKDAIGCWITDLPITPEKILNALQENGGST
jgi:4-hydroxybenzoyl-CoA reductase alpha subunit